MSTVGDYLQSLPPDRRVAMAKICSLIRRSARGVRESMRASLAFYELGGPLFALESLDNSMRLYVAEGSILEKHFPAFPSMDLEHRCVLLNDLNRIPLPAIEKIIRESVALRRSHLDDKNSPTQTELLKIWGLTEEDAAAPAPTVRISLKTHEEDAQEQ